jgi:hypothetical protein
MGVKLDLSHLKEKHRCRVFEKRILRRIFEHKINEVWVCYRRLHNEELQSLYASPNIIRVIKSVRMKLVGIQDAWVR